MRKLRSMKRVFNAFYTAQAKVIIIIMILICAWLMNSELTDIFYLYNEDRTAVKNVLIQNDDYDYKTSYFLEHEIETAISDVLEYALVYHRNDNNLSGEKISADAITYLAESFVRNKTVNKIFIDEGFIILTECQESEDAVKIGKGYFTQQVNYEKINSCDETVDFDEFYKRATDEDYDRIVSHINRLNNFYFALVNHKTHMIVSNIDSLNGKSTDTAVRSYLPSGNLLIVRNSRTPYSESGTMVEYVDFVKEKAKNYADNFDIYISFGENMEFAGDGEDFSLRHEEALLEIKESIKGILIFFAVIVFLFFILMKVSGKREVGGKTYSALTDRLPNDIYMLFCLVVFISMAALYENSLYMCVRVSVLEDYWLNLGPNHYLIRSNICMVIMVYTIVVFAGTIRRQIGCGTLFSNTYIYKLINNYKKSEPES